MRVRLILIGVGLIIIGIVLAAVLAFTTWGNPREYWTEVGTYAVGGVESPNFFETYLSAGYYALSVSGGTLSNNSLVIIGGTPSTNSSVKIVSRRSGLVQGYGITPGNPVYFQIDYDDTYAFYFTNWYPVVATLSKQTYQGEISHRNLSTIGVLIALGGVAFLILGAISTPSEPGAVGGKNTMIRLRQSRHFTILVYLKTLERRSYRNLLFHLALSPVSRLARATHTHQP